MPMTIRINEAWFSRDTCAIFPHRSPVSLSLVSVSLTNVASPGIPFWACAQDCFGAWLAVQDVSSVSWLPPYRICTRLIYNFFLSDKEIIWACQFSWNLEKFNIFETPSHLSNLGGRDKSYQSTGTSRPYTVTAYICILRYTKKKKTLCLESPYSDCCHLLHYLSIKLYFFRILNFTTSSVKHIQVKRKGWDLVHTKK